MGCGETTRNRGAIAAGCFLLLLIGVVVCACLETPSAPPGGNVTPTAAGHPQLYFTGAEAALLGQKITVEPYRTWWGEVQSLARNTQFPKGPSLSQQDLEKAARALRTNAFVYAVSGDKVYGLRAREYLLRACTWPHWQSADRLAGGQLLSYGSGAFHGAIGETYDWISPLLSDEERATVQQAMVEKSLEPARTQYGTSAERPDYCTNRIALAYGGVGVIALALRDDLPENPGVEPYAGLVHDVMTRRYFDCFDRDGGWSESIGYLSFGLSEDAGGSGGIYYAEALRRATGEDLFRHQNFSHAPQFLLYFLPPDRKGESSAFGDEAFSAAFHSAPAAALASRTGSPSAQWYYLNAPLERPDPVGEILFADVSLPAALPNDLPSSMLFRDQGWVAMRTGWKLSDTLAGFICGPRRPGHGRPERNSFMLDALGERLVITAGLSSLGYDDPDYMDYNYAAVGQNTILLNGDPRSQIDSPVTSCTITDFMTTPFFDRVQGEAAAAYGGKLSKFTRDLVFVKPEAPGFLVVRDDLATTTGKATFDFLLHALGQESITL
ncbi:MAG: heparinase II/III-family protein, partial [Methanomicrobiales archaeon]|nr:heparinase II/III-family protein [Methanomicrobiales archaeon]